MLHKNSHAQTRPKLVQTRSLYIYCFPFERGMATLAVRCILMNPELSLKYWQSFESLLKEVVTAKRLSASKMNKLTDIALNLMEVSLF